MIVDVILALLIVGILIYHFVYVKETNKQMMELTKAVMAKDLTDYTLNKSIEEQEVTETIPNEFVPVEEADERLFDKMIKRQAGGEIEADLE